MVFLFPEIEHQLVYSKRKPLTGFKERLELSTSLSIPTLVSDKIIGCLLSFPEVKQFGSLVN